MVHLTFQPNPLFRIINTKIVEIIIELSNKKITENGSFHAAPIVDGLTITTGKSEASCCNKVSAIHFVYANVFGLSPISFFVAKLIHSSSIHSSKLRIFCGCTFEGYTCSSIFDLLLLAYTDDT